MTEKEELGMLERHCSELGEFFDAIQIFVTRHDPEIGTVSIANGLGNWFARRGQVQDWLEKKNEETWVEIRRNEEEP